MLNRVLNIFDERRQAQKGPREQKLTEKVLISLIMAFIFKRTVAREVECKQNKVHIKMDSQIDLETHYDFDLHDFREKEQDSNFLR